MNEDRYWINMFANEANKLDEVNEAAGMRLVGLVDEEAGGIVAYVQADVANDICMELNLAQG